MAKRARYSVDEACQIIMSLPDTDDSDDPDFSGEDGDICSNHDSDSSSNSDSDSESEMEVPGPNFVGNPDPRTGRGRGRGCGTRFHSRGRSRGLGRARNGQRQAERDVLPHPQQDSRIVGKIILRQL